MNSTYSSGNPAQPLIEALNSLLATKRQKQYQQQFGQVSPILARGGGQEANIRNALATLRVGQGQRPTGLGGFVDFINPFTPARGSGSELEQSLLQMLMSQKPERPISPSQQIAQIKLDRIRKLEEKINAGTITDEERAIYDKLTVGQPLVEIQSPQDLTGAIEKLYKAKATVGTDTAEGELISNQISDLLEKLADTQGMEIYEEPAKKSWWGDVGKPNIPAQLKIRPKTKATAPVGTSDVRMQSAPDVALDPYWNELSDEEKTSIINALNKNPKNLAEILRRLKGGK